MGRRCERNGLLTAGVSVRTKGARSRSAPAEWRPRSRVWSDSPRGSPTAVRAACRPGNRGWVAGRPGALRGLASGGSGRSCRCALGGCSCRGRCGVRLQRLLFDAAEDVGVVGNSRHGGARRSLGFAAIGFAYVVSLIPGVYLFRIASGLLQLGGGSSTTLDLLGGTLADAITAFIIILAMGLGLVIPKMLIDRIDRRRENPESLEANGHADLAQHP